jgi:predicted O-methyltransferase YrrM
MAGLRTYRWLRALARRRGYQLVRATYYSPIPDPEALPAGVWDTPDDMPGVEFDLDAQLAFVREIAPALEPPPGYTYDNEFFGAVDADLLDAIVRWARPARVLELGSGFSSVLIDGALPAESAYEVVDPEPSPHLPARARLHRTRTQDAPLELFTSLRAGDVLFADTTHTVKLGSDVVRLVLEILPRLAPGVIVHLHDIYRPFPYPRMIFELGSYWQEHELVQALLCENPRWEVLCAAHALHRRRPSRLRELIPAAARPGIEPSSLWLRRR